MSRQERKAWDERFRAGDHASEDPDPFLAQLEEYLDALPPDRRPTPNAGPKAAPEPAVASASGEVPYRPTNHLMLFVTHCQVPFFVT